VSETVVIVFRTPFLYWGNILLLNVTRLDDDLTRGQSFR
jgi:hypothetical protein